MKGIRQRPGNEEHGCSKRLNDAVIGCGSVHDREEIVTMFIEGFDPTIQIIVQRYSEKHRKVTYLESVQHARSEGGAMRARGVHHARSSARPVLL